MKFCIMLYHTLFLGIDTGVCLTVGEYYIFTLFQFNTKSLDVRNHLMLEEISNIRLFLECVGRRKC